MFPYLEWGGGMLAARWHARGDVRVDDIPEPRLSQLGWVRLAIQACGICGTDLEEYRAGPVFMPLVPHPLSGGCVPITLGHEAVGVVLETSPGVALSPGTSVA